MSDRSLSLNERYEELRENYFAEEGGYALPPAAEVTLEWSDRLTSSAGVCYPQKRMIRLSTHYHAAHPEEFDSTLLHEMIHLLVPGHGQAFWEWMAKIRARGGRVSRHSKERATPPGSARWRYHCTRCGAAWERRRRLPKGGRRHVHKGCGGKLRETEIAAFGGRRRGIPDAGDGGGEPVGRNRGSEPDGGRPRSGRASARDRREGDSDGERYGLSWPGKGDAARAVHTASSNRLTPAPDESAHFETTGNLLVEGDNLDALKLLKEAYAGRVRMIYIDPPYNTGKRFVYRDRFRGRREAAEDPIPATGEGAGRHQHAHWLSMMYPRLLLARELMRDDGVILVHIDEHELHNLLILLEEIYGEENQLGTLVWDKRNPKGDATGIAYRHESIAVYAKDRKAFIAAGPLHRSKVNARRMLEKASELFARLGTAALPSDLEAVVKTYGLAPGVVERHRARYTLERINQEFAAWVRARDELSGGERAYCKIDEEGNVYRLVSMAWPNKQRAPDAHFAPLIHPVTGKACPVPERGWRYSPSTMRELIDAGKVMFGSDERTQPQRKYLLKENRMEKIPSVLRFGGSDDVVLKELGIPFENPKPVRFARELISYFTRESGDIVLDFFAGSGTTGHAVFELNKMDGRNRRFILVQSPEPTAETSAARKAGFATISEMTRARLERVCNRLASEETVGDLRQKPLFGEDTVDATRPAKQDLGFKFLRITD